MYTEGTDIDILGITYTISFKQIHDDERLKDAAGYCDMTTKDIVVGIFKKDVDSVSDLSQYQYKVLRHEIIHAFLFESGLDGSSDWARNEEAVDWIAIQLPKITDVLTKLKGELNNAK